MHPGNTARRSEVALELGLPAESDPAPVPHLAELRTTPEEAVSSPRQEQASIPSTFRRAIRGHVDYEEGMRTRERRQAGWGQTDARTTARFSEHERRSALQPTPPRLIQAIHQPSRSSLGRTLGDRHRFCPVPGAHPSCEGADRHCKLPARRAAAGLLCTPSLWRRRVRLPRPLASRSRALAGTA